MKPSQAGKPRPASSMAGARISARVSRPNRAWASDHERTAPGTVIVSGPCSGRCSWPRARSAAGSAAAPARPEPFSACCRRSAASQMSQNASPPMPQNSGPTTASAAFAAIAASTADPPARRIPRPASRREVVGRDDGAARSPGDPRRNEDSDQSRRRLRIVERGRLRRTADVVLLAPELSERQERNRAAARTSLSGARRCRPIPPRLPPIRLPMIWPTARNTL